YLSRGQKDVFKTFEGYEELDWTKFKVAIEEAFEGAFKEKNKAYRSADVFRAGKYLFDVDAFDRNPPEGFAPPDSESKPQGGSVEVKTRTVTLPATPMSAPVSHNMEDLLLRIKSLNVKEPEYAVTYAKIQAASPITADLLKQPYGTSTFIGQGNALSLKNIFV
ncbi:hypothetical protein M422DRAFT_270986, partial [Sphaerobolus stellatus SS14]